MKLNNNILGGTISSSRANRLIDSISFYEKRMEFLISSKPFFFERKRLKIYKEDMKKLEDKIIKLQTEIENEIDFYAN